MTEEPTTTPEASADGPGAAQTAPETANAPEPPKTRQALHRGVFVRVPIDHIGPVTDDDIVASQGVARKGERIHPGASADVAIGAARAEARLAREHLESATNEIGVQKQARADAETAKSEAEAAQATAEAKSLELGNENSLLQLRVVELEESVEVLSAQVEKLEHELDAAEQPAPVKKATKKAAAKKSTAK